jgi:DNA-binding response OmpR family regulator
MKGKTVLIVDDERSIRLTVQRALEPLEIAADEAVNGEDALARLAGRAYDLILLDLRMPGMDGMEVLRRLRREGSAAKVVIITAHGTIDNAVEAMKLGAVDFIQKPFSPKQIREIVSRAVRRGAGFLRKLQPVTGEVREQFQGVISDEEVGRLEEEKDHDFCIEQAKAAVEARDVATAEAWAQKAIAVDPTRPEGFNLLGVFCELRGDRLQAQKYYRAAFSLDATYQPARGNLDRITGLHPQMSIDLGGGEEEPKP